jgi:hypothetical protein
MIFSLIDPKFDKIYEFILAASFLLVVGYKDQVIYDPASSCVMHGNLLA